MQIGHIAVLVSFVVAAESTELRPTFGCAALGRSFVVVDILQAQLLGVHLRVDELAKNVGLS